MPLHLLGKKSWHVYNSENIARVRRDEEQAQAREDEEDRRMQEADAERRIDILRGSHPQRSVAEEPFIKPTEPPQVRDPERKSKKRKLVGEDDTDRDIRLAKLGTERDGMSNQLSLRSDSAPLIDSKGHVDLFPQARGHAEKNAEFEKEALKKKHEYEDQFTMRLSNAAGGKEGIVKPWYSTGVRAPQELPAKNVWGNDDPMRKMREQARIDSSDPLAMIKKGVKQLRQSDREREAWKKERDRETAITPATNSRRHRRHVQDQDEDHIGGFEGFSLDSTLVALEARVSSKNRSHRHSHHHVRDKDRDSSTRSH